MCRKYGMPENWNIWLISKKVEHFIGNDLWEKDDLVNILEIRSFSRKKNCGENMLIAAQWKNGLQVFCKIIICQVIFTYILGAKKTYQGDIWA